MENRSPSSRMLAVDFCPQGFGYAVFDGPRSLVDWGIQHIRGQKNAGALKRITDLALWYTPDMIVLEDCTVPGCRKRARIRRLSHQASELAEHLDIGVKPVRWSFVRVLVGKSPKATKDDIANHVVESFPHLKAKLPTKRKLYVSEDIRMNLFDAVALGLAANELEQRRKAA